MKLNFNFNANQQQVTSQFIMFVLLVATLYISFVRGFRLATNLHTSSMVKRQNRPVFSQLSQHDETQTSLDNVSSPNIDQMIAKIVEIKATIDKVKLDVDAAHAELKKLDDEYGSDLSRVRQEFARMKERAHEEATNTNNRAKVDALRDVLPILDTYGRARTIFGKLETEKELEIDKTYNEIYQSFNAVIEEFGVQKIVSVGKPLNVKFMEAVTTMPSTEYEEDLVCVEYQPGYQMGDSCVRPAMVAVSIGPGPSPSSVGLALDQ